jgi:organic hydroperoxide reductase OsmC/OhrA
MSEHKSFLRWSRAQSDFSYEAYDRTHKLRFEGGQEICGSSAPAYLGRAEHANPEELFVAALSSCHMLTFLAIASKSRFVVDEYSDEASAYLEKNAEGSLAVTRVVLRPRVRFGGDSKPDPGQIDRMHRKAHENCFIANSVTAQVSVEAHVG